MNLRISGCLFHVLSSALQQESASPVPITFHLRIMKFEFHLIFTSHKIFSFFGHLFRPFENVKIILGKAQRQA